MVPAHRDCSGSLQPPPRSGAPRPPLGARGHRAPREIQRNRGAHHRQSGDGSRKPRSAAAFAAARRGPAADARGSGRSARMTDIGNTDPEWIGIGLILVLLLGAGYWGLRALQRRSRRRSLLKRLERVAFEAAHQVLVPDGMGGFIHIDHLLLTPRGVLVLDTRRIPGLIFGGDQMSDWTVMGRRRFTFDNPQPALYDRMAAVKALVGDVPVEGRLLFSNLGRFTKGKPKYVMMLDGIELEFPAVDRATTSFPQYPAYLEAWNRLVAQLRP